MSSGKRKRQKILDGFTAGFYDVINLAEEKQKHKRARTSEFLKQKKKHGCFPNQVKILLEKGTDKELSQFFGMNRMEFEALSAHLSPVLEPKMNAPSDAATGQQKLSFTLSYLRSGTSLPHLSTYWMNSPRQLLRWVLETCAAINRVLSKDVDCRPRHADDWKWIARDFEWDWDLPHTVGAVDGKHFHITKFGGSGSLYWCYKQFPSIVLMAVADSKYRIVHHNIGNPGARCDSGIFSEDNLGQAIINGTLDLPPPQPLTHDTENELGPVDYFFIGDGAFASGRNMVVPFSAPTDGSRLSRDEVTTNYRISRDEALQQPPSASSVSDSSDATRYKLHMYVNAIE